MTIPYWHPLVVHFPIALLIVAAGGAVAWAVTGQRFFRRFTLVLLALGSLGALIARHTGETLKHDMEGDPAVEQYGEAHEQAGQYAFLISVMALIVLGGAEQGARWRQDRPDPRTLRIIVALLALTAAGFVVRAGHLGGLMVWGVSETDAGAQPSAE